VNQQTHEQLTLDTIRCLSVLGDAGQPLVHALKDLDACQDLIQASSAPDRLSLALEDCLQAISSSVRALVLVSEG
jgi:hypothetical protein